MTDDHLAHNGDHWVDMRALNHIQAYNHDEHAEAFAAADEAGQRRHLLRGHRVSDFDHELAMLKRDHPEQYTDRGPTLADVHEWWAIRQRRTLAYGGRGRD